MDLECAICCSLLVEEPDVEFAALPKRRLHTKKSVAVAVPQPGPQAPELCVPKCGHIFHKKCLINWIRTSKSRTCPSCRKAFNEQQLVTVFLPAVSQEEKKCEKCEISRKTCEELTAEKEEFKKLYEEELEGWSKVGVKNESVNQLKKRMNEIEPKFSVALDKIGQLTAEKEEFRKLYEEEVEQRKCEEMKVKNLKEVSDNLVKKLLKKGTQVQLKFLEEERKVEELTGEKEELKVLFKKEAEWRKGAELEVEKAGAVMENRVNQLLKEMLEITKMLLEQDGKVNKLTAEKEQFRKLLEEEVERRKGVEVEDNRVSEFVKEKGEIEGKLLEEEVKVGGFKKRILKLNSRGRGENLQEEYLDIEMKFLQERDKVEEMQGRLDELLECHHLLIGDVEDITKKYEVEQEKANVLEGRVASLEAQVQEQRSQDGWSTDGSSDSRAEVKLFSSFFKE